MSIPPLRMRLRPFGASVTIEADDDRFLAAARFAMARYPSAAGLGSPGLATEVHISASTVGDAAAEPAWPANRMTEHAAGLELSSGGSRVVVRRPASGPAVAVVELEPRLLEQPEAVRVFVEAGFWSAVIGRGLLYAVHSGLVGAAGAGLVLRGQSGAGKSTLTYACVRRGMTMSSDDWIYALAGAAPDRVFGYPWRMWLTVDAAERFPELAPIVALPHPGSDRIKVPMTPPVGRRRVSLPPRAIVFIEPSPDVRLSPVGADEAAERFAMSALDSERSSLPASFVAELLDRPCYVLGRGASPDAAAERLHVLALELARASE